MLRKAIFSLALMSGGAAAWLSAGSDPITADAGTAVAAPVEHVLVAAADIVPGVRIEPAALRWQPWPQDALIPTYITQAAQPDAAEELVGMAARSAIMTGEPVHPGKLVAGDAGLLSVMLTSGKRAVAVRISADNTAGGFILPNDQVDVLHTVVRQGADGQSAASSRAILRKVRVLAIDQMIDNDTGSVVGKTATLELTPEETETLVAAEASGSIALALRSFNEVDEPVAEAPVQARIAKPIRVFRGVQQETVELSR